MVDTRDLKSLARIRRVGSSPTRSTIKIKPIKNIPFEGTRKINMAKKLVGMRISALTESQLTELTSKLGMNRTEVISLAVNDFYDKMEEKMNSKTLSQAHERVIEWVGTDGDFVENLTDQQARDMLAWLEKNDINIARSEDIEKLRDYCDALI